MFKTLCQSLWKCGIASRLVLELSKRHKMQGRLCLDCYIFKSWDNYSRNKRHKSGHQAICKPCMNERLRKYRPMSTQNHTHSPFKICVSCKQEKPKSEYRKRWLNSTQCVPKCKTCVSIQKKIVYRQNQIKLGRFKRSLHRPKCLPCASQMKCEKSCKLSQNSELCRVDGRQLSQEDAHTL